MRRRSDEPDTVPLTIRASTSDGADVRLLVEAEVRPALPTHNTGVERITLALVEPALERWVGRHQLSELGGELERSLGGVAAKLRSDLGRLDVDLLRIDVAAVEHLIKSPSAPDRSPRRDPEE
ncbi:hypothetical protein DJ010_08215 [Nocardioides silvaticus]|uniref:Uncharacterized protein n=1 Tax=Nocardioides silvaticus TaxID=2201891 RepID=A0A316TJ95_9ACTN|nr:hypothetical protein [Nocardioides silvaticus]PWN03105.1 hypothetical protein DJ010_08215 [Nocardioides silvaticus]